MVKLRLIEEDVCPRCGATFHCSKSAKCWCFEVSIAPSLLESLQNQYERCLCPACLQALNKENRPKDSLLD